MKFYYHIFLLGFILGCTSLVYGQDANKNPHLFKMDNWEYNERCNPCHVYNPDVKSAIDGGFLISYESDSLTTKDSTSLSGISKLCFTCHDGTVAGYNHSANFDQIEIAGGTVDNSHPVSVIYQSSNLRKTKLFDPEKTMSGLGGTIADDMLKNGRIECTSCHDVHFSMEKVACKSCPPPWQKTTKYNSLLKSNEKSALCITCHKI